MDGAGETARVGARPLVERGVDRCDAIFWEKTTDKNALLQKEDEVGNGLSQNGYGQTVRIWKTKKQ